jgi:tetratricopeptide (TPR) repeat protein
LNPALQLLAVGLSFVAIFGVLAWLRREGLSARFAIEGLAITAAATGLALAGFFPSNPILLLVILYLVTMRVRLLTDLARLLRNTVAPARLLPLYNLALRLGPDAASRVIVQIDHGATLLRAGRPEDAVAALEEALARRPVKYFNPRYEAVCRYNLGLAFQQLGEIGRAAAELNAVIELLPGSLYAQMAQKALHPRTPPEGGEEHLP